MMMSPIFSMPHWINLSFYNKPKRVSGRHPTFIPRVKLPPEVDGVLPDSVHTLTENYFPRVASLPSQGWLFSMYGNQ
jgi:hypothetical protein